MPFNIINKISGWFSNQDEAKEEAQRAAWREKQAKDRLNVALTKRLLQMREEREQLDKAKEVPAPVASASALPVPVKKTKVSKLSAAWSKSTLLRPHPKLDPFLPQTSAANPPALPVQVHRDSAIVWPAYHPASACEPIEDDLSGTEAASSTSSLSSSQLSFSSGRQGIFSDTSPERPTSATPMTSVQDIASRAEEASKTASDTSLYLPIAS